MGDVHKVKELLEKHTPCTAQDYYGRTPLHLAVLEGHEEVVKELLGHGVDTSTADFKGRTALHFAAHGYSRRQQACYKLQGFCSMADACPLIGQTTIPRRSMHRAFPLPHSFSFL
jgi:hypothetical protein